MAVQIQSRRSSTAHDRPFPIRLGAWLLEPSDKPIGKGLESWERRWAKEKRKMQEAVEIFALYNRSTKWEGNKNIIGDFNLPQDVANFDPSVIAMTLNFLQLHIHQ